MPKPPDYHNLVSEIFDALAQHYRKWCDAHPDDDIYAYIIYADALVGSLGISVLTEQGLLQVASEYKTKLGYEEPLDQLMSELRWSVADTPYCAEYQGFFDKVNERLAATMPYIDSLDVGDPEFDKHLGTMYAILVSSLQELRRDVLGGAEQPMLYVDFGNMSDEERFGFIEKCNSPDQVEWYCRTLEMAD